MQKKDDTLIAIGPGRLVRRDFRDAMTELKDAKRALRRLMLHTDPEVKAAVSAAWNDLDVARELLEPIRKAIEGRSPPPPAKRPRPTAAQRRAAEALARVLGCPSEAGSESEPAPTLQ